MTVSRSCMAGRRADLWDHRNLGSLPWTWATDYSGRNPAPGPPTVDPGRTFMKSYSLVTAIALPMILVSGCGGGGYGGGGGGYGMNLSSAPGEAALAAYVRASHSTTLPATASSGHNLTLQLSTAANAGTTTFTGTPNAATPVATVTL